MKNRIYVVFFFFFEPRVGHSFYKDRYSQNVSQPSAMRTWISILAFWSTGVCVLVCALLCIWVIFTGCVLWETRQKSVLGSYGGGENQNRNSGWLDRYITVLPRHWPEDAPRRVGP